MMILVRQRQAYAEHKLSSHLFHVKTGPHRRRLTSPPLPSPPLPHRPPALCTAAGVQPWVKKQCILYPASHQGVKRLEVFDLTPSLRRREPAGLIIPLGDCVKIAEEHYKGKDFVFSVGGGRRSP